MKDFYKFCFSIDSARCGEVYERENAENKKLMEQLKKAEILTFCFMQVEKHLALIIDSKEFLMVCKFFKPKGQPCRISYSEFSVSLVDEEGHTAQSIFLNLTDEELKEINTVLSEYGEIKKERNLVIRPIIVFEHKITE